MRLVIPRPWMQYLLILAGVYNILWGTIAIIKPLYFYEQLQFYFEHAEILAKGVGVMECLLGLTYLLASSKPFKHWLIVFMGFSLKLIAATAAIYYIYTEALPEQLLVMVFANDIIWLIPFGWILYKTFDHYQCTRELEAYDMNPRKLKSLGSIYTQSGMSLQEHTDKWPTMLVFLRHFGCPFCRETLKEIANSREEIEAEGTKIILVHMVEEHTAEEITTLYDLDDIERISDPDKKIYKAFGLNRGNIFQLFGFNVIMRGVLQSVLKLNMPGPFIGDGRQMPGIFVIHKGMVIQTFKHTTAADRPDFIELARSRAE